MNITQGFNRVRPPFGNTGVKLTNTRKVSPDYPFVHTDEDSSRKTPESGVKYEGVGCEFGIDWFNASTLMLPCQVHEMVSLVASFLKDELVSVGAYKMRGSRENFNDSYQTSLGSKILVASDESALKKYGDRVKIFLSISGENLRAIGLEGQFRLLMAINATKFDLLFPSRARKYQEVKIAAKGNRRWKCNRIDIGCSDFEKKLPVDNLIEALKNKNYSGFENRKQFHDFESFGTLNLGARTSQRFTRAYDECAKTGGLRDAHRVEAEFKDMLAHITYGMVLDQINERDHDFSLIEDSAYQFLKELVFGGIDFVDRTSNREEKETHLDRCERFDWWQEYLDYVDVSGIKIPLPSFKKTIEAKMEYVIKQVAPTLALLKKAFGDSYPEWISRIVEQGGERISREALAMLRVWLGEPEVFDPVPAYDVLF